MKVADIETNKFNRILRDLQQNGWLKTTEYSGVDAWIDYGMVVLQRGASAVKLEWTNWDEGAIEGPEEVLVELQKRYSL